MSQPTPPTERHRLVAQWRASSQSKSAFARSAGIPSSTFWAWTQRDHPAAGTADQRGSSPAPSGGLAQPADALAGGFIELTPSVAEDSPTSLTQPALTAFTAAPTARPVALGLRLDGCRSVELAFDALPAPAWFGAMLRELSAC